MTYKIEDIKNTILQGDCIEEMRKMPDNSVDTIITDPPYDLTSIHDRFNSPNARNTPAMNTKEGGVWARKAKGFMGKSWDGTGIAFKKEIWKEMLRVAKPGATLLSFGGTRTYHRMACAIEDAGWQIRDCIMWLYGSGFPKATDISQTLDKQECRKQFEVRIGRSPTKEEFKKEWEEFRKVVGKQKLQGTARRMKGGNYGDFSGPDTADEIDITEPATPEAKLWNGWKSHGLKPAVEPILVAVKPNEGTYANNALKHGVSGLNIDGGRIGFKDDADEQESKGKNQHSKYPNSVVRNAAKNGIYQPDNRPPEDYKAKGRFPANIILDEEAGKMLDEQSGVSKRKDLRDSCKTSGTNKVYGKYKNIVANRVNDYGGGASRFFYVAKASKAERNLGLDYKKEKNKRPIGVAFNKEDDIFESKKVEVKHYTKNRRCKICGHQQVSGSPCKCENPEWEIIERPVMKGGNNHPTVKPLKLMEYLCTLTKTPTGGIVLDPFAGSFTTGIACINTDRDFIGIEKEIEYVRIGKARMKKALADKKEKDRQSLLPY